MSFEKLIRNMIHDELAVVIAPIKKAVSRLQEQGNLQAQLQSLLGGGAKRGPGRPRKVPLAFARAGDKKKRARGAAASRACAIIGCKRATRSKGYCAAHYQKFRMLDRTQRLPADWVANAEPGSVKDLMLPRGRAGAKALAEARKK